MKLDDGRVYADFVSDILEGSPILVKGDGLASRAFCYLSDATSGFFTVLVKGEYAVPYNVGNNKAETKIIDLANLLIDLFPEKKLHVIYVNSQKNDKYLQSPIQRNCPDTSRINALGWSSKTSLSDGFKRTIESYLK